MFVAFLITRHDDIVSERFQDILARIVLSISVRDPAQK